MWPRDDSFHFPANANCTKGHTTKDTVGRQIRSIRGDFVKRYGKRYPELHGKAIRSHSGRRHAITWMAMSWAQIESVKVYQGYVEKDPDGIGRIIGAAEKRSPLAGKLR